MKRFFNRVRSVRCLVLAQVFSLGVSAWADTTNIQFGLGGPLVNGQLSTVVGCGGAVDITAPAVNSVPAVSVQSAFGFANGSCTTWPRTYDKQSTLTVQTNSATWADLVVGNQLYPHVAVSGSLTENLGNASPLPPLQPGQNTPTWTNYVGTRVTGTLPAPQAAPRPPAQPAPAPVAQPVQVQISATFVFHDANNAAATSVPIPAGITASVISSVQADGTPGPTIAGPVAVPTSGQVTFTFQRAAAPTPQSPLTFYFLLDINIPGFDSELHSYGSFELAGTRSNVITVDTEIALQIPGDIANEETPPGPVIPPLPPSGGCTPIPGGGSGCP